MPRDCDVQGERAELLLLLLLLLALVVAAARKPPGACTKFACRAARRSSSREACERHIESERKKVKMFSAGLEERIFFTLSSMATTTSFHAVAPGISLAAHELVLAESPGDRSLLVLSALGLCSLAYRPLAEAFVKASTNDAFDPDDAAPSPRPAPPRYRRVVFLDLRHHGESTTTTEEDDDDETPSSSPALSWTKEALWETLAADLEAAVKSLSSFSASPSRPSPPPPPPDVLAHSLGAGVAALACARAPRLFGSLFLFEPPFYPLVSAAAVEAAGEEGGREGGGKQRDLAKDNASFAAAAAAASALSFGSREDASSLLEFAPPFKWWHPGCRRAFVEHGLKKDSGDDEADDEEEEEDEEGTTTTTTQRERRRRRGGGGGGRGGEGGDGGGGEQQLVFRCGGRALAALASGLMTSSGGGPSRETYRALGRQQERDRVVVISYSAEPRSDVTAFLRSGALAAAGAAAEAAAASSSSSAPSSSSVVVVLPVRLPKEAKGARSGHYAPLVCPEELGRVAAAAMMPAAATKEKKKERGEMSRF